MPLDSRSLLDHRELFEVVLGYKTLPRIHLVSSLIQKKNEVIPILGIIVADIVYKYTTQWGGMRLQLNTISYVMCEVF